MHSIIKKVGLSLLLSLGAVSLAQALPADFMDKLQADTRPEVDKARDGARRPYQVMTLLGVQEGWTVVDVAAGGGWFTRVISAAVGPNGKVIAQVGARALQNNNGQAARDMAEQLGNVELVFDETSAIAPGSADAAVTALNLHDAYNFRGEEGAQTFLKGIFDALKSGGVAMIIDHEGDEGANNADLHRIPTSVAREQILAAGFEIVTESDLLDTPADDHTLSSNDPILGRDTDCFLFIVRKP
ncbi:MAG TPA: class I SAM-dependent methyltransferase [Hyphomicrobiales bacterium]|nr:class I SAM-dependent methyltransferase [Hyphomicrobiales bacterium]